MKGVILILLCMLVASCRMRPVTLPAHLLMNIKFGLCGDYANLAMFAMRAAGIPVGIEIVPFWGRGNGRHTFLM